MEDPSPITTISSATAELEIWRNFNLEQRKLALDKSCVEMREAKTASITGRKRLNDITKAFRAKPKEEQILMMTEILKCYQEEIDQLSRRSKYCETTFFTLYKALYELPDPALTIDGLLNTVMSSSTNQLEIERLRGEINQYDEEFRQLKNQDITIRRLEDKLTEFKEQNENKINEEVNKRMIDIQQSADNRITEILEIQKTIEKRYNSALESMNIAQQSADRAQTQLYEISSQTERKITALQSENSILAEGTQRLSLRLAEKERENQNIQQTLSTLQKQFENTTTTGGNTKKLNKNIRKNEQNSTNNNENQSIEEDEEELKRLQILVASLREEIMNNIDQSRQEKSKLDSNIRELTQLLNKEKEINMKLQEEIKVRPSRSEYMAVRRQLRTVTKIAFNVQDEDDGDEGDEEELDPTADADHPERTSASIKQRNALSSSSEVAQLETLLAGRIKTLETELATLRRDLQEARRQESVSKEQIVTLKKTVETSAQMITRLENDLDARSAALEASVAAAAGVPHLRSASTGSLHQHHQYQHGGSSSYSTSAPPLDLAALLGVQDHPAALPTAHTGTTTTTAAGAVVGGGGNNQINVQMISILQSQRDQYKDKLTRAETMLQKLQVDLESAQQAKQRLETDNLALYSKIKYLQSYNSSGNTYKSPQAMRISNRPVFHTPDRPGRGDRDNREIYNPDCEYRTGIAEESRQGDEETGGTGAGGEVEGRYHQLYEQRMNPFDQFSQREKQRKLQELTVADRIVLNTTMALVSNQTGRNFLLLYLGAMHLFMFCIIYYTAHQSHAGCDASIDHLSPEDTAAIAANHM